MSSADCGRREEVILRIGDAFYRALPLRRSGGCRAVFDGTSVETKSRGRCREVAFARNVYAEVVVVVQTSRQCVN